MTVPLSLLGLLERVAAYADLEVTVRDGKVISRAGATSHSGAVSGVAR